MAFDKKKNDMTQTICMVSINQIGHVVAPYSGFLTRTFSDFFRSRLFRSYFAVTPDHVSLINYNRNESEWDQ